MTEIDFAAFAAYCAAYGRWAEAEESLRDFGVMLKSPNNFPVQSPYLAVANRAMTQMRSMLSEFGMSPASRSRVAGIPRDDEDDEFARWMRGDFGEALP